MNESLEGMRHKLEGLFDAEDGYTGPILLLGVLLPMLVLGLLMLSLSVLGPAGAPPSVPDPRGLGQGSAMSSRAELAPSVQDLAQELDRAIATVENGRWLIADRLDGLREKLTAERRAVQSMEAMLEEMKQDANAHAGSSPQSGNLLVKYGALQRGYESWQAAATDLNAVAAEMESALALVQEHSAEAAQASHRLAVTLQRAGEADQLFPVPGDEKAPIAEYVSVARIATQELSSTRAADAQLVQKANELLGQGRALAEAVQQAARSVHRPQFRMGFKLLADQIPTIVGEPMEDEHPDPATGNMVQRTTRGMMTWRKADNWTGFTDGVRVWYLTPSGVQVQPDEGR